MTGLFFALIPLVCPTAPGGVTTYTNQIAANTLFVAQWMFGIAFVVCVILLLVGKAARMHHLTQGAAVGLAVVLLIAIIYVIFPGMLSGILGSGCVALPGSS
ncbi:hypothetical protein [Propioniciclava tarda]|uniref:Uncharacterized protein n=1 Tax=Propioniciclava tarda TaxID=433330 RepID=A0A4Q9KMC6_PROTD|nr:hypothetical protein [Propioniciclava tarda]TBT95110.1 hypothetical protein ET996_07580 [Propioniciclava tarda]SMO56154.1 hypothetical protein SAMN06266982_106125 [Propioniciclava tarda]